MVTSGFDRVQSMHWHWSDCDPLKLICCWFPSDQTWKHVWRPPVIVISVAIHDISLEQGPVRIMSWEKMKTSGVSELQEPHDDILAT